MTSVSLLYGPKQMEIQRCKVWTVCWMVENFILQLLKGVCGMGSSMRSSIVVQEENTF
jgi:hypothetical protein